MKTDSKEETANFQNGRPLLPKVSGGARAATSNAHKAQYGNDAIPEAAVAKDGAGVPAGYKPDTSVTYHAGKDGKDTIKGADGVQDVSSANANMGGNTLETLPKDHTYRDRVEAQAKSLGVEVVDGESMELLMWKIRMQASS